VMESINNGMTPQGSATPDSNCSAKDKKQPTQLLASSVQIGGEVFNAKIATLLNNGITVNYFDYLRAGGKFAYIEKNRPIDMKHVEFLLESIKRVGMLNSIKIVAARKLIEEGHPLRDRTGNILTLATPNIDMYNCILDGQHKADALALWAANEETRNIPLEARIELVNIPKGISTGAYIAEYNLACKKWNHRDTEALLVQTFEKEGRTVLSRIEKCVNEDKMTQRAAWKIYKMIDGYRKQKFEDALFHNKLSDELRGTDAEIERGDRIRRAIQVACRKEVRMKRNSAIIDAVIAAYNAVSDVQKAETMDQLMLFITSLSEQTLLAAIKADSVSQKTETITQAWKNFQKEIKKDGKKEEYEALALNAEEEYDRMVSSVASPKKSSNLDKIKKILS
ncbi:MAG: hypothetical protein LUD40_16470, partial [Phocaeicola dorei]|nr:hypothetical protein [Phocaeicola dorei]